jgi:hypothetical protein
MVEKRVIAQKLTGFKWLLVYTRHPKMQGCCLRSLAEASVRPSHIDSYAPGWRSSLVPSSRFHRGHPESSMILGIYCVEMNRIFCLKSELRRQRTQF